MRSTAARVGAPAAGVAGGGGGAAGRARAAAAVDAAAAAPVAAGGGQPQKRLQRLSHSVCGTGHGPCPQPRRARAHHPSQPCCQRAARGACGSHRTCGSLAVGASVGRGCTARLLCHRQPHDRVRPLVPSPAGMQRAAAGADACSSLRVLHPLACTQATLSPCPLFPARRPPPPSLQVHGILDTQMSYDTQDLMEAADALDLGDDEADGSGAAAAAAAAVEYGSGGGGGGWAPWTLHPVQAVAAAAAPPQPTVVLARAPAALPPPAAAMPVPPAAPLVEQPWASPFSALSDSPFLGAPPPLSPAPELPGRSHSSGAALQAQHGWHGRDQAQQDQQPDWHDAAAVFLQQQPPPQQQHPAGGGACGCPLGARLACPQPVDVAQAPALPAALRSSRGALPHGHPPRLLEEEPCRLSSEERLHLAACPQHSGLSVPRRPCSLELERLFS